MAISTSSKGGVTSEINVTPMIDVMLVLLIIFMIVTPLIAAGFQATLPKGDPEHLTKDPEKESCDFGPGKLPAPGCEVILGIDQSGAYFLQGRPVEEAKLEEALTAIFSAREEDKVLYLKADNKLKYGRVQQAVEMARTAGVRVIAAVTEAKTTTMFQTKKKPG